MKTIGLLVATAFAATLAAPASAALFVADVANSSVTVTETGGEGARVSAALAPGLKGTAFELESAGDSETFDFIDFSVTCDGAPFCAGVRSYDISATLAFDPPQVAATGSGSGGALVLFGTIMGGYLFWDGVPQQVDIGGGGLATIDFEEGIALLGADNHTASARVTLDRLAAVPLPAGGFALLGALAAAAAAYRRRAA